jgi:glyoxylase-like metal-dependent hydrolase (beta-lactamase superfamily II)
LRGFVELEVPVPYSEKRPYIRAARPAALAEMPWLYPTPFLQTLAEIGWSRDSVQAVVCTHLHVDHVGWNTMLEGGKHVPTFPNARCLIGRVEHEHWRALEHGPTRVGDGAR